MGSPELDTVLQMGPHQGRVEGKENLPRPAGHTPLNAPQDPIGLLGNFLAYCKQTVKFKLPTWVVSAVMFL